MLNRRMFTMNSLASLLGLRLGLAPLAADAPPQPGGVSGRSAGADFAAASAPRVRTAGHRHRLIVLSDIGSDSDDTESMCRVLLYSNEIDIEGLIATTSTWKPYASPEMIRHVVEAYGRVHGNLVQHDANYPPMEAVLARVKHGLSEYGMTGVGRGKDSEGSDWIIRALEKDDPRPLWVTAWGGPNTLAQALYRLRATRSASVLDRLIAKLRVYTISDQDDSGPWMRKNFPKLFYIVSPGGDYAHATWRGINTVVDGIDNTTISNAWLAEHIQQGHGPLGAAYPDVAYGMEGDTPSWLGLIPNGLNDMEHPDWGSWGGRYELYRPKLDMSKPSSFVHGAAMPPETRPIWTNASDDYTPPVHGAYGRAIRTGDKSFQGSKVTLWRWRDDFQNDFAARMDWTTKSYAEANHPPVPVLDHPDRITVHSGQQFTLSALASTDPDGDSLSFYWFPYPEAGTCPGKLQIVAAPDLPWVALAAPKVTQSGTVHLILRVTDKGTPPLSRYKRVIITVEP